MQLETHNSRPATAGGIRVLIVDDNPAIKMQHVELLTRWGYITFVAQGKGEELAASARELAKRHRCQIALVDKRRGDAGPDDWSGLHRVPFLQPPLSIIVRGWGGRKPAVAALKKYGAVGF